MGHLDELDTLPLLDDNSIGTGNDEEAGRRCNRNNHHSSHSSIITLDAHREHNPCEERKVQPRPRQQQQHGSPLPPFDIESEYESYKEGRLHHGGQQRGEGSYNIRERQQHQHQHQHHRSTSDGVARLQRSLLLARPVPFDPITDPFALVCDIARRPKFGHQYVLCPDRRHKRNGHEVGLSVGPHWSGVIYTMSMIGVITIFLVRFIMNDAPPWCQPVTVACSLVTTGLLVATAIADPGIVVESAERGEGRPFCKECSIWRPDDAEHCEECGVCIFGMDHHCPWMGKCVGRGNILWFRLFNGSWILFLSLVVISMPYFNRNKGALSEP
ncbi:unnamed protein product [Laminaria digitata]